MSREPPREATAAAPEHAAEPETTDASVDAPERSRTAMDYSSEEDDTASTPHDTHMPAKRRHDDTASYIDEDLLEATRGDESLSKRPRIDLV